MRRGVIGGRRSGSRSCSPHEGSLNTSKPHTLSASSFKKKPFPLKLFNAGSVSFEIIAVTPVGNPTQKTLHNSPPNSNSKALLSSHKPPQRSIDLPTMSEIHRASTTAPVNIAVIKYWGKRDPKLNLPTNSSLSVTLSQADLRTHTTASCSSTYPKQDSLLLNGQSQDVSGARTQACFRELRALRKELEEKDSSLPKLADLPLRIVSENNFPTAAGLASSAAGFAALVRAIANLYALPSSPHRSIPHRPPRLRLRMSQPIRRLRGLGTRLCSRRQRQRSIPSRTSQPLAQHARHCPGRECSEEGRVEYNGYADYGCYVEFVSGTRDGDGAAAHEGDAASDQG